MHELALLPPLLPLSRALTTCAGVWFEVRCAETCSPGAGTNRGAFASLPRHRNIRKIVDAMQGSCKLCDDPFSGSPAPIDGTWELLYTTAEAFR